MARPGPRHPAGRLPLLAAALLALALVVGVVLRASADDAPATAAAGGPVSELPAPSSSADPSEPSSAPPAPSADAGSSDQDGGTAPADEESTTAGPSSGSGPADDGTSPTARSGSSGSPSSDDPTGTPDGSPSGEAPPPTVDTTAVLTAVTDAGARAGGTVQAVVLGSDGTELVASPGAGDQIWTASLSKTLLISQLLDGDGGPVPGPDDLQLVERALTSSDDSAMNTLWTRFDGPALLGEAAGDFGLLGTAAPVDPSQWGEATTTARDYARFLHGLDGALDPAALASVLGWLRSATPTAADGFDQTFGLLSPAVTAGGPVAAKQGWMCCVGGQRQLHSAGVLPDGQVVVLLGDFPSSTGWAAARTALDEAAQAAVSGTAG